MGQTLSLALCFVCYRFRRDMLIYLTATAMRALIPNVSSAQASVSLLQYSGTIYFDPYMHDQGSLFFRVQLDGKHSI